MDDVARVVLALETPRDLAEEVLHFLDRSGRARVVATTEDGRQLADAVRQTEPHVVVAEPMLAIAGVGEVPLLALSARESVRRCVLRYGRRREVCTSGPVSGRRCSRGSRRPAVRAGPRSLAGRRCCGARLSRRRGCTFVATHLAQAVEREGLSCVMVDLDLTYADLTAALGAEGSERSIADLVPVCDELTWEHIQGVLWKGAVLAPPPEALGSVDQRVVRSVVETAASHTDVVLLHLARGLEGLTRWAISEAERVVEVVNLDVLSFRASSRMRDLLADEGTAERWAFVVDRAARSEITPGDVRRVFGVEPLAVIAHDAGAARAQDHGRLLPPRGRVGRTFARLAQALVPPVAEAAA